VGPNMQNFAVSTREFLERRAIVQVSDEFELVNALRALLESEPTRSELGRRAQATFEEKLNAAHTQRTAAVIVQSLEAEPPSKRR
jgi:3-deoxy-D-manno-octulosonic-acid transferase